MTNFVTTLSKLTGLADYYFQKICIKLALVLIIYPGTVFTAEDMLNTLALSQATNVNEITRKNTLSF